MTLVTGEITAASHSTDSPIPTATRVSSGLSTLPDSDAGATSAPRATQPVVVKDQFAGNVKLPVAADRELTPAASGTGASTHDAARSEPAPLRTLSNVLAKAADLAPAATKPVVVDVTPKSNARRMPERTGTNEPAPIGSTTTVTTQEQTARPAIAAPASGPLSYTTAPTEHQPLGEMSTEDAARYFAHLDTAFADIDTHRGVMHGPMQWPQPDTPPGQQRVETLVAKLFKPKERPESAYTTLILYMPAPGDPRRLDKIAGFATATSRQLRVMVEQGVIPLATATVLHQSLARHAAAGSPPKDAQTITRMFERKRLEVVSVKASPR